ncbi:MAG: glycosyltransferase family 39 protein [Deltaproteobacteria bacterium]|nr:glycosyltransferase family 39 protein [Deltaproteobacteria bacterium]
MKNKNIKIAIGSFLVFLTFIIFYSSTLDRRPFYTRGEGREALVVSAMLEQRNYVLPLRNGLDIPSKPPMFHWMAVLSSRILQGGTLNEFAIRFPSALCAAVGLGLFFGFISRVDNFKAALLSSLILATSFEWSRSASHARVDMCFAFWFLAASISLFANIKNWQRGAKQSFFAVSASIITIAFAVLSKGPAGLILPWTVAVLYMAATNKRPIADFFRLRFLSQAALMIVSSTLLAGVWYYLAYCEAGMEFINLQLLKENVARVVSVEGADRGHEKPFYFSGIYFFISFFPWSVFFPLVVCWCWKNIRNLRAVCPDGVLYSLVIVLVFLLVVTLSISKREVYLLPAFPAAAYLLAHVLLSVMGEQADYKISRRIASTLFFVLFVLLLAVAPLSVYLNLRADINEDVREVVAMILAKPLLAGISSIAAVSFFCSARTCWKRKLIQSASYLGFAMLVLITAVNGYFFPVFSEARSPKDFMSNARRFVPKDEILYKYGADYYSAIYYYGKSVPDISRRGSTDRVTYLITAENYLDNLREKYAGIRVLARSDTAAADGRDKLLLVEIPG